MINLKVAASIHPQQTLKGIYPVRPIQNARPLTGLIYYQATKMIPFFPGQKDLRAVNSCLLPCAFNRINKAVRFIIS